MRRKRVSTQRTTNHTAMHACNCSQKLTQEGVVDSLSEDLGLVRATLVDVFLEPNIHNNTVAFNLEIENALTAVIESDLSINIVSSEGKQLVKKQEIIENCLFL